MARIKVTVTRIKVNGRKKMWQVRWHEQQKVRRRFFAAKDQADAQAAYVMGQALDANEYWLRLTHAEQQNFVWVMKEATRRNIDLPKLVLNASATSIASPASGDALKEILDVKRKGGLSLVYLSSLQQIVKDLIGGIEAIPLDQITFAAVEQCVQRQNLQSQPTYRARLSTFFKFGVRRGYCKTNPCERLEPVKVPHRAPRVFTLNEIETLLAFMKANPRAYAWFILSTFAGLRPEEAQKTDWSAIDHKEKLIRVEAQTSKVNQRRIVYPMPAALDLLEDARRRKSRLPMTRKQLTIERWKMTKAIGLEKWPQDVTRHTAASMWLAVSGDAAKVAHNLGHSERVLHRHYKALVTRETAEKFWAIR